MKRGDVEKLYDDLLALDDRIERKGKSTPYTSVNGHMFSFITNERSFVAIRLPQDAQEKFMKEYNTAPVTQHGAIMRGYVELPSDLLADTKRAYTYLKQSYDHISSLKPKPTKKK